MLVIDTPIAAASTLASRPLLRTLRALLALVLGASGLAACAALAARPTLSANAPFGLDAEAVRATELRRLRALVAADIETARQLHAEDFQVINPLGRTFTRTQYLDGVAAAVTDYLAWEADSMSIRVYGPSAVVRYRSQVEMTVRGERRPRAHAWNTAVYEKRGGRWQIVWFQVTEIE